MSTAFNHQPLWQIDQVPCAQKHYNYGIWVNIEIETTRLWSINDETYEYLLQVSSHQYMPSEYKITDELTKWYKTFLNNRFVNRQWRLLMILLSWRDLWLTRAHTMAKCQMSSRLKPRLTSTCSDYKLLMPLDITKTYVVYTHTPLMPTYRLWTRVT